jgi:hypothetical protein
MKDLGSLSRSAITLSGTALQHITGGDAYCYFVPSPPLNGVGQHWQLTIGNTGSADLPTCDFQMYEVPMLNDTPQEVERKLNFQVHNFGRVLRGAHTTQYLIEAGPNRRYRFILTTPCDESSRTSTSPRTPRPFGGYKTTCEIRTPDEDKGPVGYLTRGRASTRK